MAEPRVETGLMIPWDDIPDSGIIPAGFFLIMIDTLEAQFSKTKHTLQIKGTYIIQEPKEYVNFYIYDYFPLGTEEDPNAHDPTLYKRSFGFQKLKGLFKALEIPIEQGLDQMCIAAEKQSVMLKMNLGKDRESGNDRNQVSRYLPLGEREPGLDDSDKGGRVGTIPMMSKPGVAFQDSDETAAAAALPNGAATAPPAAAKPPLAVAPRATATPAPIAPPSEEEAPSAATRRAAAKKEDKKKCPLCNREYPTTELKAHMINCEETSTESDQADA